MRKLEVDLWVEDHNDVVTYTVEGDLKRPGPAVEHARERATEDGYDGVNLKEVRLSEPSQ